MLCEKGLIAYSLDEKQLCTLHVPHPLDLHSSPVTCLHVISNVSDEIISSMMSLQSKQEVEGKAVGKVGGRGGEGTVGCGSEGGMGSLKTIKLLRVLLCKPSLLPPCIHSP